MKLRKLLIKICGYDQLYTLYKGAITAYGWKYSLKINACVDRDGRPIPWMAYPAIDVLEAGIHAELRVFEFGSGNSTLWWARHVKSVHSVEHEENWYDAMCKKVPGHVTLHYVPLVRDGDYCRRAQKSGAWDVIVVDGRDRVNCIKQSLPVLAATGVIVLDNSDRDDYQQGIDMLRAHGFRELRLRGLAPLIMHITQTSIFYRDGNCLNL